MGRVEDAYDRSLHRPVAIKHMLSQSDIDLARFEREARITARLEHPGIVPVHETGRGPDGTPYYVMRRIDGRPLSERISGASLTERIALIPNVLAACDAVAYAHASGVVHRDIKPTNILVGPFGETLVIDWGLAREIDLDPATSGSSIPVSDEQLTRAGTVAGTPGFMAPEQARGESVDARADVFALGATLFYVLAGRPPYVSAKVTEMVDLVGSGRPPDWRALPDDTPADVRAIVVKALAADAELRYRDAGELAADLRRFVTGNLVGARDYGAFARIVRFVRRHRAVFAVAALSAIALAVVATLSVRRIVAERDDANAQRALAEARQRDAQSAADRLLVQHARELAATDPAGAIAILRTLSPTSTRWREAWLAAVAAWSHGIPFGFVGEPGMLALEISADNRQLVVTSRNTGHIYVYDLIARTHRLAATVSGATNVTWIGPDHVACWADRNQLVVVDVVHGTTRGVGVDIKELGGDRKQRVLALAKDGRLFEVIGPTGEPHTLAEHVTDFAQSGLLEDVVLVRGTHLSLWRPSGEIAVPDLSEAPQWTTVNDHMIVALTEKQIHAWKIDGDRVVEFGTWPRGNAYFAKALGERVYAGSFESIELVSIPGVSLSRGSGLTRPSPFGFYSLGRDGLLQIFDKGGVRELGPNPLELLRADVSADGRFAAALTGTGDVIAWDLAEMQPRYFDLEVGEQLLAMRDKSVWTTSPDELVRRELATFGVQRLPTERREDTIWAVDPDDRYAAFLTPSMKLFDIFDLTTKKVHVLTGEVTSWTPSPPGIVYGKKDGTIKRWEPGWSEPRETAKIEGAPVVLAANGGALVAVLEHGGLARIAGGVTTTATIPAEVHALVVAPDATAWLADRNGGLWRWRGDDTPVRVELPEPLDALWLLDGQPVAHSPRSLTALDTEPFRSVHSNSSSCVGTRDHVAACVSASHDISLLDLETGGEARLQTHAVEPEVIARDDTVAYVAGGRRGALLKIPVPRDPIALRGWLARVTNAKPVPGSEVVAWP
jgi:WD40 repeat protein